MTRIVWDQSALAELAQREEMRRFLGEIAEDVAVRARSNASAYYPATRRVQAIITRSGTDGESAYADVGYASDQPGFVLWFSEVGTVNMSPRPHLRAALQQTKV